MMFGPARFDLAGEEFLRIIQEELAQAGHPSSPEAAARLLGVEPEKLWWWLDQREESWLQELVKRWNTHADGHQMARIIVIDHGDEVEVLLGHPLRPGHV